MQTSLFLCPVCGRPLAPSERGYACAAGHNYDRAAAGYAHLLLANQKHSQAPGDDKAMAAARNRFLSAGYYAPLLGEVCRLAARYCPAEAAVLDSGCGEGYYTAGVWQALRAAGRCARMAGIDISKFSLRWAAKRTPEVEFAVASAYRLPVASGGVDLLLNCFSPLALEEFRRVIKPGGCFLYVVPGPRHLWRLKEVLYETPYENRRQAIEYEGFRYCEIAPVQGEIQLETPEAIRDLFGMTPYCWKTPRAGADKLARLTRLTTEIEFDIHVFRREE